jgi:NAD(P)-dependent dehydrogenase (short-subunit alcohol dehydrogenase family)
MSKSPLRGKTAVVTGAGAGIGRALAVELSRRGARVACGDIDQAGLDQTVELCGSDAAAFIVDVSDRAAMEEFAGAVVDRFGVVHQIYNNAGIALNTKVLDSTWNDYERLLRIDLNGVIHGTQAFLPHLIASGDGHVVNMSSLNGLFAQPLQSHYCAAKFAVRGFTEALRTEMILDRHPVKVSVVHPGGVATSIAENGLAAKRAAGGTVTAAQEDRTLTYSQKLLTLKPERAAEIIVRGVEKGRPRILVGRDAVFTDFFVRLAPAVAPRIAVEFERRVLGTD